MTDRQSKTPLSRRQARDLARSNGPAPEVSDAERADAELAGAELTTAEARPSRGRRVQWDPAVQGSDGPELVSTETPQPRVVVGDAGETSVLPVVEAAVLDPSTHADDAQPAYRIRDFRPASRRASFAPVPDADAPIDAEAITPEPASDEGQTAGAPDASDDAMTSTGYSVAELIAPERTMTRRELRELRARAEAAGEMPPEVRFGPDGVSVLSGPITGAIVTQNAAAIAAAQAKQAAAAAPAVDQSSPAESEPSENAAADSAHSDPVAPEPVPSEPVVSDRSDRSEPAVDESAEHVAIIEPEPEHDEVAAEPELEVVAEPVPSEPVPSVPVSAQPVPAQPATPFPLVEPISPRSIARDDLAAVAGLAASDELIEKKVEAEERGATPAEFIPPAFVPPTGHWSTQADLPDDHDTVTTGGFSAGAITTHALVLPSMPETSDNLLNPLLSTGETIITGSVDLPRSFGSTGAHPPIFDHPDVDALIAEADREDAESDSAPVRAIRAVSSNASTRGVIESTTPKRSRLPLILGITAGGLVVAVVGLLIAGFITGVF